MTAPATVPRHVMRARGLFANSAFALAGDLASKGAVAVMMVLAARQLAVGQLALLAFAIAAASILSAALDMGAQMLLTRDGVRSAAERSSLFRSLLVGRIPPLTASLLVAGAIGVAFGHVTLALLTVVYAALGAGQMLLTGALRSAQNLMPEAALKLLGAALTVLSCVLCIVSGANAIGFLVALSVALALTLAAGAPACARVMEGGRRLGVRASLRGSLPLGAMTLVTLVYYRSGTLALKLLSSPTQTALFATASTIGFALLMAPNAITTGLLPKLSATARAEHPALMRRAVAWALLICSGIGGSVALGAHPLLVGLFGARYGPAAPALRVLALTTLLIGPTGVLGTVLIARGQLRPIYVQVAVSLAGNLLAIAMLVPACGALGAALATLACEALAFVITAVACLRAVPGCIPVGAAGARIAPAGGTTR
ncbi:MAG: polysaccharide biosynthesis C-terminal domain-containing protein [Solirubrobacteraceae bacterium]|jgi:O-antigen/teichoic acid export membrane protein